MPQNAPIAQFSGNVLLPVMDEKDARETPANIAASQTLVAGTVMAQYSSSANDLQTLTIGGTPTGGTFPLTLTHPITLATYTLTVNFNSTVAQTQALVNATPLSGLITVGGGTLPGATQTFTGAGNAALTPIPIATGGVTGLTGGTPTFAVAHTTVGRSASTWAPYTNGGSTGLGTALGLLKYDVATDGNGNITFGGQASGGEWTQTSLVAPVYISGYFDPARLTGLDSAGAGQLGKMVSGAYNSATGGILCVTGV